jgi:hypothetical protein
MKTQAWGWLAAAVVAAALNASYHDGGLRWAHAVADRFCHSTTAVLASASGQAAQFLTEAHMITARAEAPACPWTATIARAQAMKARSDSSVARVEEFSAREQARWARFEAQQARMEAKRAQMEARLAAMQIPTVALTRVVIPTPKVSVCPRVRVDMPRMPEIKIPAIPSVHIDISDTTI